MALERNYTLYNQDGTIVETGMRDFEWNTILMARITQLEITDIWMLTDRYNSLTSEQQTELTTYRQALRDITTYLDEDEDMDGANNAADNFPNPPSWL
jgi:hypothetical protein|tara:strand:+ start:6190 stop:6483 length:294 start_codon:yes stop_codon:yes gene_type:complete